MKIHCLESRKKDFEKVPFKELRDMVGWVEPDGEGNWDVTLMNKSGFECQDQATAQIIASTEEIKAMLIKLLEAKMAEETETTEETSEKDEEEEGSSEETEKEA